MHTEHAELISELRLEIKLLNREHERLQRAVIGALSTIVEQMDMLDRLREQIKQEASCP